MNVNTSESPFQKDEACFSKAAFFDVLAEDGEITFTRPQGIPLSEWKALEGQKQKYKEKASTSTSPR